MPNQSDDKSKDGQLPKKPGRCRICNCTDFWYKESYMDNWGKGPIRIPGHWCCNRCEPNPDECATDWSSPFVVRHTRIVKIPDDF